MDKAPQEIPGSSPGMGFFLRGRVASLSAQTKSRQGGSNPRSTAYEAVALPLGHTGIFMNFRGSIVVSIPACHAGNPGSIPGLGAFFLSEASVAEWLRR